MIKLCDLFIQIICCKGSALLYLLQSDSNKPTKQKVSSQIREANPYKKKNLDTWMQPQLSIDKQPYKNFLV